jgi:hypothetical protein
MLPRTTIDSLVAKVNESTLAFIAGPKRERWPVLPQICSEWGFSSIQVTPEQQADDVLRTHRSNLLSGVPVAAWHEGRESMQGAADSQTHYGLIDCDGENKPAIVAGRNIRSIIRDDVIAPSAGDGSARLCSSIAPS